MTKSVLLDELKNFCKNAVKDYRLPTVVQKNDIKPECRPPEVYKMRLPHTDATKKYVPYILLQLVTSKDEQQEGELSKSSALVRFIFCVYGDDEQEGALSLLNVMETIRIELLKKTVIGGRFCLDRKAGVETLIYPDNTAPFYAGEMMGTFYLPPIEREVNFEKERYSKY